LRTLFFLLLPCSLSSLSLYVGTRQKRRRSALPRPWHRRLAGGQLRPARCLTAVAARGRPAQELGRGTPLRWQAHAAWRLAQPAAWRPSPLAAWRPARPAARLWFRVRGGRSASTAQLTVAGPGRRRARPPAARGGRHGPGARGRAAARPARGAATMARRPAKGAASARLAASGGRGSRFARVWQPGRASSSLVARRRGQPVVSVLATIVCSIGTFTAVAQRPSNVSLAFSPACLQASGGLHARLRDGRRFGLLIFGMAAFPWPRRSGPAGGRIRVMTGLEAPARPRSNPHVFRTSVSWPACTSSGWQRDTSVCL
jgi:hypothetical protein